MNIQLFNFLEDYNEQIVNLLMSKIPRSVPAYAKMPRTELKQLLEHLLDGYVDTSLPGAGNLPAGLRLLHKPFTPAELARRVREALDAGATTAA